MSGYSASEILTSEPLVEIPGDPLEHLERRRLAYVAEIERCAQACLLPADRAAILLKLAKLTSLGKLSVDVHATLDRLQQEPDMRALTRDDLERILNDQAIDAELVPLPEEKQR